MRVRGTSVADAEAFVQRLAAATELVSVSGILKLCRDPDDDLVLETAAVGHATHLVSRDEDVTRDRALERQLERWGVQIVTVSRFLAILEGHELR
jgi:predicted nucleic acid-binding protein